MTQNPELAKKLRDRFDTLKGIRDPWNSLWDEIARYVMPRRTPGLNGTIQSPGFGNETLLFDTTAVRANMVLANGQLAWMSPLESPWFAFEPRPGQGEEARMWLAQATEIAREELAVSNFYLAIHEAYLDRSAFGTCALYIEPGRRDTINAQVWPVGSFVIDEDECGIVDTVIREFKLTARQAVQKFGSENISEKLSKVAEDGGGKSHDRFPFLHCIYPREDAERDTTKLDDVNMPVASVYMEVDGNHICKTSGYEEMPVCVSRYLEWGSGMGSLYGWSPSFAALPEARQLNFLQKMMDALAEKAAFPPLLAPDELEGEIDANAMGVTYFSRDLAQSLPRNLMDHGDYKIGLERIKERQQAINDAFHVDLFQMFAQIEKQMTAREVSERAQEKLIQFSPTFARLTSELFNPGLARIFGILLRSGHLGEIPQSVLQQASVSGGIPVRFQYSSRIALALRSLPSIAYAKMIERVSAMAPIIPSVLDNYNFDFAEREVSIADGIPADFLRKTADVDAMRKQRAQQEAQMQQQAQAMQAAEAASKVGKIPSGSPVGKIIDSQIPQAA